MEKIPILDDFLELDDCDRAKSLVLKYARPNWDPIKVNSKTFSGGISNRLYGFYVDNELNESSVLVRINGPGTEAMVDRDQEFANLVCLHEYNCFGQVFFRFQNGIAYQFIPGTNPTVESVRSTKIKHLIAEEMARLHRVRPPSIRNEEPTSLTVALIEAAFEKFPESFSDQVKQKFFTTAIPSKDVLLREKSIMLETIESCKRPLVFSHNDLLLGNIVISPDETRAHFIDFEFSSWNYDVADIVIHFCEWAGVQPPIDYSLYPSKEEQLDWIRYYLTCCRRLENSNNNEDDEVSDETVEELYRLVQKLSLAVHFVVGLWSIIQAVHSPIEFDFLGYAKCRFDRYFETKEEFLEL